MTTVTAPSQADSVLARDYERLKPDILRTVRGKLAATGVRFDDSDLDGFYNQAWYGVHTKLTEGERVENVNGLLVTITQRRALDEFRALRADSRADPEVLQTQGIDPDLAARVDDHVRLRHFVEGMRERLDRREREAAALCYVQDYSRGEAALAMGVKPRRMEKIMDGVSKKVGAFVGDIERDEWCDARHSMIKAYALGLLDPDGERYALASEHLDSCSACRRDVLRMRGIAALTPPVPLLFAALAGATTTGAGGAGAGHFLFHGGGAAAKVGAVAAAGTTAAAATFAIVSLAGSSKRPVLPPPPKPAPALVARATPAAAPTVVAQPRAKARTKAKPVKRHAVKKRRVARRTAVVAAVRTPAPTVAATPVAPVAPVRSAAPSKPATDGAGEFELR